jgi:hypothetical protein
MFTTASWPSHDQLAPAHASAAAKNNAKIKSIFASDDECDD